MASLWPPREIPPVPPNLKDAATEGNLVVFVGAGISMLRGSPSWDSLAEASLKTLAERGAITFGDVKQLEGLDARQRLTIAQIIAKGQKVTIDYNRILSQTKVDSRVYEYLCRIGCVFVTTNYDRFLDDILDSTRKGAPGSAPSAVTPRIYRPEDFHCGRLREPGNVVHLHGCVDDPDSMIVTTSDYLKHYSDQNVQVFLRDLFKNYVVLFVGYGLKENELLEYIFAKGEIGKNASPQRFLLYGFYHHEEKLHSHLYPYFEECFGVQLLPFPLDYRGYTQIETIMKDWAEQFNVRRPSLAGDLQFMEDVLNV